MSHWDQYFARRQAGLRPAAGLRTQLMSLQKTALAGETCFDVLDFNTDSIEPYNVETDEDLKSVLTASPTTGVRIISISADRTIAPLNITSSMAAKVFDWYSVRPEFLRVLLSFGNEPHQSEANSANSSFIPLGDDAYILLYKLNFVELNGREGKDPWSFRHVGVYHHHTPGLDLFILLHCQPESEVPKRLEEISDGEYMEQEGAVDFQRELCAHPVMLHHFVLSSYLDNWRMYLRHLGDRFSVENNKAMVLDGDDAPVPKDPVAHVRDLRNTKDWALFASACCRSNLAITGCILRIEKLPDDQISEYQSLEIMLRGYIESSEGLRQRIDNTVDLASYTLNLRGQKELRDLTRQNEEHIESTSTLTLELTSISKKTGAVTEKLSEMTGETGEVIVKLQELSQKAAKDGTVVLILAIISAVYLPGSFVGSIFGSNFFSFNEATRHISVTQDFWIFVLLWLGLTGLTGGAYVAAYRHKPKQQTDQEKEAMKEKTTTGVSIESSTSARA